MEFLVKLTIKSPSYYFVWKSPENEGVTSSLAFEITRMGDGITPIGGFQPGFLRPLLLIETLKFQVK